MSQLLDRAVAEARKLSDAEQDTIAARNASRVRPIREVDAEIRNSLGFSCQ